MLQRPHITPISHPILPTINFVISDCPSNDTIPTYIPLFQSHNVKTIIRISHESTYDSSEFERAGILVIDSIKFIDGSIPSESTLEMFRNIVDQVIALNSDPKSPPAIAIHCVSGIGRAPLLVTVALMDAGMDAFEAIEFIRSKRRGSLNKVQVDFLCSKKFPKRKGSNAGVKGFFKKLLS